MKMETPNGMPLATTLDALRRELSRLTERVAILESNALPPERAPAPAAATSVLKDDELSEEIVLVIAAAVAAYLGKKAHVRQICLVGSPPWAQQGRVVLQASHSLGERGERRPL
jgi:methylmalonyl-CoA carboxyltransferase 12S subunit